jgi:hypothetical protein
MRIRNPDKSLAGIRILTTEHAKQTAIIQKSEYDPWIKIESKKSP